MSRFEWLTCFLASIKQIELMFDRSHKTLTMVTMNANYSEYGHFATWVLARLDGIDGVYKVIDIKHLILHTFSWRTQCSYRIDEHYSKRHFLY